MACFFLLPYFLYMASQASGDTTTRGYTSNLGLRKDRCRLPVKEKGAVHTVDWETVRSQFTLSSDYVHLGAAQFIASHPKPVREAIKRYRQALDENPVHFVLDHENQYSQSVRIAAARYLGMDHPDHIALTDSTTMGLGLIYNGLLLKEGQEILMTEYDHFSHQEAIRLAVHRANAQYRIISLYKDLHQVSHEEIVNNIVDSVRDNTRVIGLTWVHSSTGLKTPVAKVAQALKKVNAGRKPEEKVLLIVDGVHGFGIETETFNELGCDFFITGCHKWLLGPRGTGIIAGTEEAWQQVTPIIPTFTYVMDAVTFNLPSPQKMDAKQFTPGGFHSLEHRWALKDAFHFVESIGKEAIRDRVYELNLRVKDSLQELKGVKVHTPTDTSVSAGIVAFEVDGYTTEQVVNRLKEQKIISTSSPYRESFVRFTPGIYNKPQEVDQGIHAVRALLS
jgi:isopenicillin-N epimerase